MLRLTILGLALLAAAPASAQITQSNASGVTGLPFRNNAAFDSVHEVYLVIVQRPPVMGRFLDRNGVQIGADFRIATEAGDPYTAWASVAFGGPSNDPAFIVTYTVADLSLNPKFGRLVRYVPGGAPSVSAASFIANAGSEWLYSEKAQSSWNGGQFVVGTRVIPPGGSLPQPQVNLFDMTGAVSGPVVLGDNADFYGSPALACANTGICLTIGFKAGVSTGYSGGTYGRLFDGLTLTPQGGLMSLENGRPNEDQGVTFVAHTGYFLTEWFRGGGAGFIDTRLVGMDGSMSALDYTRGIGPGAGCNSIIYNPRTRTSLLTTKGANAELLVMELGDDGYPVNPANALVLTNWDGAVLDYLPSSAADTNNARWLVSFELTSTGFGRVIQGTAVAGGSVLPINILTGSTMPAATAGVAYNQILIANGSTGPYAWSKVSGALPPGINLAGGSLAGTSTAAGVHTFRLRATGADSQFIERDFSLQVLQTIAVGPGVVGAHIAGQATTDFGAGHSYRNNAAWDPIHEVYLVITQRPPVTGRFFDKNGVQISGDFRIALEAGDPFTAWVSIAFGGPANDPAFLVTYTMADLALNPKFGRLVRYVPGGAASVSNPSFITNAGSEWLFSEKAQNVWNGQQFVVGTRVMPAGASLPTPQVNLFDMNGGVSAPVNLGDGADYYGSPAIACQENGICLAVGFKAGVSTGYSGGTYARRFVGNTLVPQGSLFNLAAGLPNEDQGVVFQTHTGRFLAAWFRGGGGGFIDTRLIGTDGTMSVLDMNRGIGPGAGCNSLSYNAGTHTTLLTTKGANAELLAIELGDDGYPLNPGNFVMVTPWDGAVLDYLPSNAADATDGRWLLTFELSSIGFRKVIQGTLAGGAVPPTCSYSLNLSSSGTYSNASGSGSFVVTTGNSCVWSAAPSAGWIHTTSTGAGTGPVTYTIDANAGAARSGNITVGGQVFSIAQAGPSACSYSVNLAGNGTWGAAGASGAFLLTTGGSCAWSSAPTASWIHTSGGGPGSNWVTFTVDSNPGVARSASISAGGQSYPISQAANPVSAVKAVLTSPAPGSSLTGPNVTFQWTAGVGVSQYWLEVGTTPVGIEIMSRDMGSALTADVTGLPTDGSTVYVRVFSFMGGAWVFNSYTLTAYSGAGPQLAQLISPAPGSTLTGSAATFSWSGGSGVLQYWLQIGTIPGGMDLYSNATAGLSLPVSGLPVDGRILYVRLKSYVGGVWQDNDYTLSAVTGVTLQKAQLLTPAPSSTLTSSAATFSWTGGTGVLQYWLQIGNAAGGADLYSNATGGLSLAVSGLPTDGRTLYVRLKSYLGGVWQDNDYTVIASAAVTPQKAQLTSPAPGSTLTSTAATFSWTGGVGVTQYWLEVGTTPGGVEIVSRDMGTALTTDVVGLPNDGSVLYVRVYSFIGGVWLFNSYTLTSLSPLGTQAAQLISPAAGSTLTGTAVTFQWSGGTGVSQYALSVGSSPGNSDVLNVTGTTGLSASATGLPNDGRILYVRLQSLIAGNWAAIDYTVSAVTAVTLQKAQLVSPAPSSSLTSSAATFSWTGGTGVLQYWLQIGNTVGGSSLYSVATSALSLPVTGLPTDGRTLYVRLWSYLGGAWQQNNYTLTASSAAVVQKAQLTSPAPGSTLTSTTVTFQWTGGVGVSQYWLEVGTTPGGFDIMSRDMGGNLAVDVGGLPNDGRTIYVRVYSLIAGVWQFNSYTLTSASGSDSDQR